MVEKIKIVHIVRNDIDDDPRVFKYMQTLKGNLDPDRFEIIGVSYINEPSKVHEQQIAINIKLDSGVGKIKKLMKLLKIKPKNYIDGTPKAFFYLIFLNIYFACITLKIKADIYHVHDLDVLLTGLILSKIYRSKLIYDSHELFPECSPTFNKNLKKLLRFMERICIERCDEVITVNKSIANELYRSYHIKRPRIIMNFPKYQSCNNKKDDYTNINLYYHGGLALGRGLYEIIEAMKYIDERCTLFIRGVDTLDGMFTKDLKRKVVEFGLEKRVLFIPPVRMVDMIHSIDNYDIGILSYKSVCLNNYYASPNKTFEYMMGGLALAVPKIPEQVDILKKCNVGISFDPENPTDIANKINEFISNIDNIKRARKNALICAKEFYNWELQEPLIMDIYNTLIQQCQRHID